ncbi:glycerophosphodiester phosphodiesterase family protein [Lactobacillus delbrueckii subsp. bulgaricus]|nr:glycerophosphodiester phosphodiesterase [Lactobacillus delbrueckii subsp. bulgaricus]MBT8991768.1 glycerophosphodiester phosphodiesterase [Lactobacillus delbrueckii subsp. bulgaricus]MBT8993450.1 glycerophosphodiester phosphodiesterase [Lactobacillus delbrueckii subsp. bulgaricus]MBT9022462.1 glycerophosphodiester phosphodiesterase [Lactobacillus delbrueckii subsp. bulgaricus]
MNKRKDIKKLLLASAVLLTFGIGQQLEPLQPVHAARQVKKSRKAKKGKKAKVSINKKKLSLLQGKTARLYLKNSKKKTTWRSSNKKVATVSSKGKVKAVKAGTAKITAKNGKKRYACMVKVTAAKGTLTFASNDGSGRRQKKIFTLGKKVTLPKTGFYRKGYKFLNYTVATNGKGKKYRLGKAYTFKKSTTLWAQYRKLENYTIQIAANHGFGKNITLHEQKGDKIILPETGFSKPGYVLDSFNTQADGSGEKYDLGASYALKNVTLYAQYRKQPASEKPERDLGLWGLDSAGNFYQSKNELTTVDYIRVDQTKYLALDNYFDYQIKALKYRDDKKLSYVGVQANWSKQGIILDPGYKYLIMVRKSNRTAIKESEIADIAKLVRLENVDVKTQSTSGLVKAEVKFIAHRGYSTKYPENTTLAFEKAGEEAGVWGIETDVDNTSDNKLVIMHDNTLARTTNISADDPNYRKKKNINDIPFDQVENYKIKGVLNGVDKDKVYEDLRVPTLRQYLEICKKYGKEAFLELKYINNMEALKEVVKEINEAGMQKQTTLISFNIGELEEVRNVIPGGKEIAMMGIYSRHLTDNDYIFLSHLKAGADCDFNKTTLDDILAARKYGVDYGIWTVCKNDNAVADMIKNGVDKVTLNDAGLIESMSAIVNN